MFLFLFYTVMTIPHMVLYSQGSNESILFQKYNTDYEENTLRKITNGIENLFFKLSVGNLGKSDFLCENLSLLDLEENFSLGPPLIRDAKYNFLGVLLQKAVYGEPPVNLTNLNLKCNFGEITNLIDLGLSTPQSHCPTYGIDDSNDVNQVLESVHTDPKCSYRGLQPGSSQFNAVNKEFRKIMGLENKDFRLNLNTMFDPECYDKTMSLIQQLKDGELDWNPKIFIMV